MMAAWNAKADQKRDEQMGDDDQDTGADDVMKRPCMKRPAANGIGGGHGLPNTKPKSKAKSQPKSKAKSHPEVQARQQAEARCHQVEPEPTVETSSERLQQVQVATRML